MRLYDKDDKNISIPINKKSDTNKISNQISKLKEKTDKLSSKSLYKLIQNETDKVRN